MRYARLQQIVADLDAARSPARATAMARTWWLVQSRSPFGGEARRRRCEELAAAGAPPKNEVFSFFAMPTTWPPIELGDIEVPSA